MVSSGTARCLRRFEHLDFGFRSFLGSWCLGFGISPHFAYSILFHPSRLSTPALHAKEPLSSDFPAKTPATRRKFLQASTAIAGAAALGTLGVGRSAHAAGGDTLKVGLIGCGGRGSGAASDAMKAEENVQLTVLADVF